MAVRRKISNGLSDFPFHYKLKTRWKDMDAFGHMNNAVFLTYIEDARITFFKRWTPKSSNILRSSISSTGFSGFAGLLSTRSKTFRPTMSSARFSGLESTRGSLKCRSMLASVI